MTKIVLMFIFVTTTLASVESLENKFNKAKSNTELKKVAYELQDSYREQIKEIEKELEKKLDKKTKEIFISNKKKWISYYESEKDLIYSEFNSRKYGSSAAVHSVTVENQMLKARHDYLKRFLASL